MLRVQLAVAFSVLILAVTGVAYMSYNSAADKVLDRDAAASLHRAATIIEQDRRLAEYSLRLKAEHVASGADLFEAIMANYAGTEENPLKPAQQAQERKNKVHERLLKYRKEAEIYETGEGKGVDNRDLPLLRSRPVKTDLFFVVDAKGIGLAALGKDLYAWYGVDVSKDYPMLSEVMVKNETRTAFIRFAFKGKSKSLYQVAMAPIRKSRGEKPIGVVVMGNLLNDGVAKKSQALIMGSADKKVNPMKPEVAFIQDDRIVASTLDTNTQSVVAQLLKTQKVMEKEGRDKTASLKVNKEPHMAKARVLYGQHEAKKPIGVVVMTNLKAFKRPLRNPGTTTVFAGLGALVVGVILVMVFVLLFLSPLAKLEQGIQEIIAGNKDYEFEEKGHKVSRGLAQQLNLLSAFLQGKRMPDDEDAGGGGGWGDIGASGQTKPAGHPKVAGVSMADLMGKRPDDPQ